MHAILCFALLPPGFWTIFSVEAPVKIITIAGVLCTLIQIVKSQFPQLGGWYAIALNVIFSVAGVLSLTKPDQMLTITTFANILTVALGAAGMHGTAKLMGQAGQQASTRAMILLCGALLALGLTGCGHQVVTAATPPQLPAHAVNEADARANQTLQTIHAFAARISTRIQAGQIHPSQAQRSAIDKVNGALNVADAAEQGYHNGGGGDASVLNATVQAVQTAFLEAQRALALSAGQ